MRLIELPEPCRIFEPHDPHAPFDPQGDVVYICPGRTCPAPVAAEGSDPRGMQRPPIDERVAALAERAGCEPWQVDLVVQTVMSQPEAWGLK